MATAYYNEIDPYAVQWLRNLIEAGHIAPGDVDERSIVDVRPSDLVGYAQCHFFAGIGGWSLAARLAGWPDERSLWTGSCPCQPFSVAGKGQGADDRRHLWPVLAELIRACRPDVVMGEQVAAAVGKDWLDGVHSDLEGIGYACGAAVVPACAVDAPHRRDRLWFVADRKRERRERGQGAEDRHVSHGEDAGRLKSDGRLAGLREDDPRRCDYVADTIGEGLAERERVAGVLCTMGRESEGKDATDVDPALAHAAGTRRGQTGCAVAGDMEANRGRTGNWHRDGGPAYVAGADGKARRIEPSIRLLAHGVPARVGKLRAYGNAIVPQVAAEVIGAYLDARTHEPLIGSGSQLADAPKSKSPSP